jgi:hypothetical protein
MLCFISTPTYDLDGVVALDVIAQPEPDGARRRVNRIATLDGGVVLNDFGFSDGDRTLLLRWRPTGRAQHDDIDRLLQTYPLLQVSTRAGVYLAAPEVYVQGGDESSLRLLVKSKLTA